MSDIDETFISMSTELANILIKEINKYSAEHKPEFQRDCALSAVFLVIKQI